MLSIIIIQYWIYPPPSEPAKEVRPPASVAWFWVDARQGGILWTAVPSPPTFHTMTWVLSFQSCPFLFSCREVGKEGGVGARATCQGRSRHRHASFLFFLSPVLLIAHPLSPKQETDDGPFLYETGVPKYTILPMSKAQVIKCMSAVRQLGKAGKACVGDSMGTNKGKACHRQVMGGRGKGRQCHTQHGGQAKAWRGERGR